MQINVCIRVRVEDKGTSKWVGYISNQQANVTNGQQAGVDCSNWILLFQFPRVKAKQVKEGQINHH